MSAAFDLPQIEPESFERADAARNRERILRAARRLFGERGVSCVSMDEIAEAAGVGKGTLFRRFGSRASLAAAVLSERERAFQEGFIRGEPPLGPGAPPQERLIAFGEALLDTLELHSELLLAAESGAARFAHPAYRVHRLHVMLLLGEADARCDSEVLADTLLSGFSAELFVYLRRGRGLELERLKEGWRELVRRTVPSASAEPV
ncbi:MAG TPA: helix-turn-helix domain-containing protein [Solirubrobacteraceae bacterium]|jgi:AcrR family transcriptional regulator|nr:helix-turn-helix domain-containing protein [Solirubrobacteraceae bacterium]